MEISDTETPVGTPGSHSGVLGAIRAPTTPKSIPLTTRIDPGVEGVRTSSFASSLSVITDQSELSSLPSAASSKATTPADAVDVDRSRDIPNQPPPPVQISKTREIPRRKYEVRPKVSMPPDMSPQAYAMRCIAAAELSRLNPYALHQEEYQMLRDHISHAQVTTYLNIRNGILRLWVENPQIAVTRQEALGCAKDSRWFDAAGVCFDWLVRRGYINFGCVEIKSHKDSPKKGKRKTIVVIGAGMSGLGCARQLEGLFMQYAKHFHTLDEDLPEVIVLEGRDRIGGRVYSRPFKTRPADSSSSDFKGTRFTAEMGGMIVTGFERGNPLNILVRGQLGLAYYDIRHDTKIYDSCGKAVDTVRDLMAEKLWNYCLERVSEHKFKQPPVKHIEGNRDLIDEGRDSSAEVSKTIAQAEETTASQHHAPDISQLNIGQLVDLVPVSSDRVTGRATGRIYAEPGIANAEKASRKAELMGFTLKDGITGEEDIDVETPSEEHGATLGSVMDHVISQYKDMVDLTAQDCRLINWHIANLEYANATDYTHLSLRGWDIDAGNEWEGTHTMIIGGYQSVPRGLMLGPTPLNIRKRSPITRINYQSEGPGRATVECEGGFAIEADYVVSTIPLGVLKHGGVDFQPPLPSWKTGAISRLGFGVLNKVILVYKEAFWDQDRDIFGVLRDPPSRHSLNQKDYSSLRGRFFQWMDVSNTSGMPVLLALMAGEAGRDTEQTCNDDLVEEATDILRTIFGPEVPNPVEAVVTRWGSDKFTRGSYSSSGPDMQANDYDVMARPIGNLFFAGEHTAGSHPATVHGAYLSGLRAASEVLHAILGPILVPTPLIPPKESSLSMKRKLDESSKDPEQARLEAWENSMWDYIVGKIGPAPFKPTKQAMNAYLFFSKANTDLARKKCEEGRRAGRASANDVRTMCARMWKDATPEEKRPFEVIAQEQKVAYLAALRKWHGQYSEWEAEALRLRYVYQSENPFGPETETAREGRDRRSKKKVESYAESDGSDVDAA